jgi:hypothetical protein
MSARSRLFADLDRVQFRGRLFRTEPALPQALQIEEINPCLLFSFANYTTLLSCKIRHSSVGCTT